MSTSPIMIPKEDSSLNARLILLNIRKIQAQIKPDYVTIHRNHGITATIASCNKYYTIKYEAI